MQELEKILEEIDQNQVMLKPFDEEDRPTGIINVDVVKGIIRKHMNDGNCGECSRRKWYLKGYEDGKKSNDGWIPVEERLPETNEDGLSEDVLVSFSDSHSRCIGFYDFNKKRWYVHGSCPYIGRLIAWRPLPEPYRPERRKK